MELVIGDHACVEYLAEHAMKVKMSSNACDIWQKFEGHVTDNSLGKSVLQNLFMKSVGEVNGITRSYTANSVTETVQFLFHVSNKVTRK